MTDYTSWHVGMKVVCVDDRAGRELGMPYQRLTKGRVYTIRRIGFDPQIDIGKSPVHIWLDEVSRLNDVAYGCLRFRPVQKRKTSIEIFERLLTNPHVRIEEDA